MKERLEILKGSLKPEKHVPVDDERAYCSFSSVFARSEEYSVVSALSTSSEDTMLVLSLTMIALMVTQEKQGSRPPGSFDGNPSDLERALISRDYRHSPP